MTFSRQYQTIVVDPPWRYKNNSGRQRQPYADRTMTLEQVKAFDIGRWVAPGGCHLYLWVWRFFRQEGLSRVGGGGQRRLGPIPVDVWGSPRLSRAKIKNPLAGPLKKKNEPSFSP